MSFSPAEKALIGARTEKVKQLSDDQFEKFMKLVEVKLARLMFSAFIRSMRSVRRKAGKANVPVPNVLHMASQNPGAFIAPVQKVYVKQAAKSGVLFASPNVSSQMRENIVVLLYGALEHAA